MIIEDLKKLDYLKLSDEQLDKLNRYMEITLKENEHVNLTRNDTVDSFITKNILDSLLVVKNFDLNKKTILDIGSGAGLPGIPLAIYYPKAKFVLLEPTFKRASFLAMVSDLLELNNVKVVAKRAEDYVKENNYETFDFVVSRAVSKLNILIELSVPFLKVGGELIAYKGLNYLEEIEESKNALKILNSTINVVKEDILDFLNETRYSVSVKKNKITNHKYPRLYKDIKKRPL